jgi:hypothetical protein
MKTQATIVTTTAAITMPDIISIIAVDSPPPEEGGV